MTEPNAYRIEVVVPYPLPLPLIDSLFVAVADAVRAWEPADRQGWDAFVAGSTIYSPFDDEAS